jgi:pimeloyl-ACP methyl ester carboxylesterase
VADQQHRADILGEPLLQQVERFQIEIVGRLVEYQQVRRLGEGASQGEPGVVTTGQHADWLGFDNAQTVAIHDGLKALHVPTLIVWGLQDFFFDKKWAYWLRDTIPGVRRVVEVDDARLFFPEDRPESLTGPMLRFWDELAKP